MNYAHLKTVINYADKNKVSHQYIYKLIKEQKIKAVEIDGVKFIDTKKYPEIPK